jgi:3-hydroxyacyl-CoA dehydrogenase/3-hydroxy-2-methylbutyryl-CoA dehydrogenase
MDCNHAVVVVTGGGSGLGLATAKALLDKGSKVAIWDIHTHGAQALLDAHPKRVTAHTVDVTDTASVQAAMDALVQAFGCVHVLVNCAGVVSAGKTLDKQGKALPMTDFFKTVHINLVGSFHVASVLAQSMAQNTPDVDGQRGVIIHTASVAAFDGQAGQVAYAASKAGVVGMTLPMARDLARDGIRVMSIAPGIFETPMMGEIAPEYKQPLVEMVQNPKRLGLPAEYAQLCISIIENNYLNAETIRLDGGIRMQPK